jgi:hypothetical protein
MDEDDMEIRSRKGRLREESEKETGKIWRRFMC